MKYHAISYSLAMFAIIASSTVNATHITIAGSHIDKQHSSSISSDLTKTFVNDKPLACNADSVAYDELTPNQSPQVKIDTYFSVSLVYLNDAVEAAYNTMRNRVISYVTTKVALSLFNFSVNGFAPENIATYVSNGTKPFLPFEFANGVKITAVAPKGGTIVYRAEMPIPEDHNHAVPLVVAGRISAITTVRNDKNMVDDLLGRDVVIQYDYYDSKGAFFCSFTIKG